MSSSDLIVSMNSTELIIQDYFLAVQCCLSSLSNMLSYIALYEFICSQSPHSMKGLLIGLSFATQGLFQAIGMGIMIPFLYASYQAFLRCWMYYFFINVFLGLVSLLVLICVAKRYNFRQRNEPCHVYQYAEEYYSKVQDERLYDYSDSHKLPAT